jgi:hypothetical protein
MPIRFAGGSGGISGSVVAGAFNATTKILPVTVTDNTGASAVDGTVVSVAVVVKSTGLAASGSPFTGTTTGGVASVTLTGLDTTIGYTFSPSSSVTSVITGGAVEYAPSFGIASFTGSQSARKTTGGLNPTGDVPTATLNVSGGSVTTVGANTSGANMTPGVWQTITTPTGGGRGQAQVKTDGTLDWTTATFTGVGHDGIALSTGTGIAGSTTTAIITRKETVFIFAAGLRAGASPVSGEYLFNGFNNIIQAQMLTGWKLRTDLATGGLQYRATDTANLSNSTIQDHITAIDLRRAYNGTPPGQQVWLNDVNVAPTPTNYAPVVDNTTAGLIDVSNTVMASLTVGANAAGSAGFLHADLAYIYIAWGLRAIDTVTGLIPDFSNQTVRNRFLPGNINLTNGSGVTGRQPQIFMTGDGIKTGVNLGAGGNLSTITGTF